jgi:hypothetical protein
LRDSEKQKRGRKFTSLYQKKIHVFFTTTFIFVHCIPEAAAVKLDAKLGRVEGEDRSHVLQPLRDFELAVLLRALPTQVREERLMMVQVQIKAQRSNGTWSNMRTTREDTTLFSCGENTSAVR